MGVALGFDLDAPMFVLANADREAAQISGSLVALFWMPEAKSIDRDSIYVVLRRPLFFGCLRHVKISSRID